MLSPEDYSQINDAFEFYQITCNYSNCSIYLTKDEIQKDSSLEPGIARLSRYQRALLRLGTPSHLTPAFLKHIELQQDKDPQINEKIKTYYDNGSLRDDLSYDDLQDAANALKKTGYEHLQITPVIDTRKTEKKKPGLFNRIKQKISDFYLGRQSKTLRSGRPYEIDESERIVRLAPEVMTLLGIEETDQIILKFKNRESAVRAMPIDDMEQIEATNIIGNGQSISYIVGIPAGIRSELGMHYIDTSVSVQRDTSFLFAKHLNIQLLSIFGLAITIIELGAPLLITIILIILFAPFVLYAILAPERKRVS